VSGDKDPAGRADQHNARGIELADRGWLDEAVKEFQRAIELDPEAAHPHDNLSTVYAEQKRLGEALQEHLTALRLDPESATAHFNLASFLSAHATDLAVESFRTALALDPVFPDAQYNLGLTLADDGRVDEALTAPGLRSHGLLGTCRARRVPARAPGPRPGGRTPPSRTGR